MKTLFFILLFIHPGEGSEQEDVGVCLSSGSGCTPERDCEGVSFGEDRSCLTSAIQWHVPHHHIKCCFRCCLYYWQKELGLDEIYEFWDKERIEKGIPNKDGIAKHGWPNWDDVIFSHMTPFAWASTRHVSGAFLGGTSIQKDQKSQFEVATPAVGIPGGFAMYEGAYPPTALLDPSHSGATPAVIVVGTDEWLGPIAKGYDGVKETFVSNPKDVSTDCTGAPIKGQVHDLLKDWYKSHPDCISPEVYYATNHTLGTNHAFPRALQKTTGWEGLLGGGEARLGQKRKTFLHCGASMKLRGSRSQLLQVLKSNGFPCLGSSHTSLNEFATALQNSKLAWSPPGHGWSNHRELEIFLSGAIPVVEFHPNFLELYRHLPVVQVEDWSTLTPEKLQKSYDEIEAKANTFNMNKIYWPYWLHELTKYMSSKASRPPRQAHVGSNIESISNKQEIRGEMKPEATRKTPPAPPSPPAPPPLPPKSVISNTIVAPDVALNDEFLDMDGIGDEIL